MQKDDLFNLIKSLNQTEKRYFKIFAAMNMKERKSSYLKMFEAIERQKKCDEKEFLSKYKDEPFAKNFRFNKHYLLNLILKSMRLYHGKGNVESQLSDIKRDLDFLYKKKLFKSGYKLLVKAQKLAQKYEVYSAQVELYKKEHVYSMHKNSPKKHVSHLNKLLKQELAALRDMENVTRYEWLNDKTEAIANAYGEASVSKANAELKKILKNPLLQDYSLATTITSRMWYHLTYTTYHYYNMNYQKAFEHNKMVMEIINSKSTLNYSTYSDCLMLLSRQIVISGLLRNYKAMAEGIRSAKTTIKDNPEVPLALRIEFDFHELSYYTATADFDNALLVVKKLEGVIYHPDSKLNSRSFQVIYYNFATVCFISGEYKQALDSVIKLMQMNKKELRPDIRNSTYILNILINYELGKMQFVTELANTAFSVFKKDNMLGKVEEIVLGLFKKEFSSTTSKSYLAIAFLECLDKLKEISKIQLEKNKLQYLDIISWLESKIQNRSFAAILREKALQKSH